MYVLYLHKYINLTRSQKVQKCHYRLYTTSLFGCDDDDDGCGIVFSG